MTMDAENIELDDMGDATNFFKVMFAVMRLNRELQKDFDVPVKITKIQFTLDGIERTVGIPEVD
jgi:hypothetical protein